MGFFGLVGFVLQIFFLRNQDFSFRSKADSDLQASLFLYSAIGALGESGSGTAKTPPTALVMGLNSHCS